MMKVTFFTRVECKPPVPLCSLMKARILLDAYFTISPSKVAVITPLKTVWKERKPDPIWVTALKIASYVLLVPFALLALFAKCALYCIPLHKYAPRMTTEIPAQTVDIKPIDEQPEESPTSLIDFVKRGKEAKKEVVEAAIAELSKDKIDLYLGQLEEAFKRSFPQSCPKKDYQNASPLSNQQKARLKNYIMIKAQLVEALLSKEQAKTCIEKELAFVRHVAVNALFDFNQHEQLQGYAALKAYCQDVINCFGEGFRVSGFAAAEFATLAQNEILSLLNEMAGSYWTLRYTAFLQECENIKDIHKFPKLVETRNIILCVCGLHWPKKNYAEEHAAQFLSNLSKILS